MKKIFIISCFLLFCFSYMANAQPITLDPTFGQNGMTIIPEATEVKLIDFDQQGNIIAVGISAIGGGKHHLTIAKTNADGIIDQNFGTHGIVNIPGYNWEGQLGLKITKENKIFITGNFYIEQLAASKRIFMQFNENGSLDEAFGENGRIILDMGTYTTTINLESDDFILFGGGFIDTNINFISKWGYNGELDHSFGENEKVYLTDNETYRISPRCIKILNDQSIIVAGHDFLNAADGEVAFCKLDKNGNLVTDFANNGIWKMNISEPVQFPFPHGLNERFIDVIEDSMGNLILLGWVHKDQTIFDLYVFSFTKDGILDTTFGTDGFYFQERFMQGPQSILQNESNYIVMGVDKLISINQNGTLDTSFNNTGLFTCENYFLQDMKLQGGNKLILGGAYGHNPYNKDFLLARLNISHVSVKQYPDIDNFITVFPNPVKDDLYFNTESKFEIIDILGKIVLKSEKAMQSVNVSQLKTGVYFIRFEGKQVKKFVKQ